MRLAGKLNLDPTHLNIPFGREYVCPVCGFTYATVPAYDFRGGIIGATICPCCLWEPGFDDDPAASGRATHDLLGSVHAYRAGWAADHAWRSRTVAQPDGFDGRRQLAALIRIAPFLA